MRNLLLGLCLGLAGCAQAPSGAPAAAPTPVTVSHPVERDVTDYADFTGRTAAVDSVEVRARVWGYLDKVNFKEGALVKKGDVLFEIDPRPYQADAGPGRRPRSRRMRPSVSYDEAEYQRNRQACCRRGVARRTRKKTGTAAPGRRVANLAAAKANRRPAPR